MRNLVLCVAVCMAFSGGICHGEIIAGHYEANDPLTEGFTVINGDGGEGYAVYGDEGLDAWNTNGVENTLAYVLSTGELASAAAEGWAMRANVRITTPNTTGGFMLARVNDKRLQVRLHSDADNNAYVECWNDLGNYYYVGSGGYHLYELMVDTDGIGDLYIDGVLALENIPNDHDLGLNYMAFQGIATNWNSFEAVVGAIPEPASLNLLVMGAMMLLSRGSRRRS